MARRVRLAWMLLAVVAVARTKPLDSSIDESANEVDHGLKKISQKGQQPASALPTNDEATVAVNEQTNPILSAADTVIDSTARPDESVTPVKSGPISWFLTPLTQKIQFSPQTFLQDRLILLKEALNNLGINVLPNATAKQFSGTGLVHFLGPNDSGFYTNRLEPAGFLGGNGWFANKGGILGGPGAIVSTGSLLTDYPTAYRK